MAISFFVYCVCFLLLVLLYYLLPHRFRWPLLLAAGYGFCAALNAVWLLPLLFITAVSYPAGRLLEKTEAAGKRKALLACAIGLCLLCFASLTYIRPLFAAEGEVPALLIPLGIGFYTLRAVGYLIDVYRGDTAAEQHVGYYALFIGFFPLLAAGPLERAADLLPQLRQPQPFSLPALSDGLRLTLWGLIKKVIMAAYLAPYVNRVFSNVQAFGGLTLTAAAVMLCMQLYCDFSGCIDIAAGCAAMLGLRLTKNYRSPFLASSLLDFWRRCHITLAGWFRDYVYRPLRSLRGGRAFGVFSLLAAGLLYTLWHGVSPTVLLWGAAQGVFLLLEHFCAPFIKKLSSGGPRWRQRLLSVCRHLWVLLAAASGFVMFRSASLADFIYIAGNILRGVNPLRFFIYLEAMGLLWPGALFILFCAALLLAWDLADRRAGGALAALKSLPAPVRWVLYYLAGFLLLWFFFTQAGGSILPFSLFIYQGMAL